MLVLVNFEDGCSLGVKSSHVREVHSVNVIICLNCLFVVYFHCRTGFLKIKSVRFILYPLQYLEGSV